MPIIQFIQSNPSQSIHFIELSETASPRYHAPMSIDFDINAEVASNQYFRGDLNRPLSGGHSEPVSYSHGGVLSGVRRLQHGLSRKTRGVLSKTLITPDNSGCKSKPIRVTIMTALSACNKAHAYPTSCHFIDSPHGVLVYQNGLPVAWIVAGHHHGQVNNKPHTCTFIEVVYRRQTQHGVNLETFEADSIEQAFQALQKLFSGLSVHTPAKNQHPANLPKTRFTLTSLKARNPFTTPAQEVAA
jgi:hypothetical protein